MVLITNGKVSYVCKNCTGFLERLPFRFRKYDLVFLRWQLANYFCCPFSDIFSYDSRKYSHVTCFSLVKSIYGKLREYMGADCHSFIVKFKYDKSLGYSVVQDIVGYSYGLGDELLIFN